MFNNPNTQCFGKDVAEAIEVAEHANPNNFHHSEVRKLRRGFRTAVKQLVVMAEIMEGRAMKDEL